MIFGISSQYVIDALPDGDAAPLIEIVPGSEPGESTDPVDPQLRIRRAPDPR